LLNAKNLRNAVILSTSEESPACRGRKFVKLSTNSNHAVINRRIRITALRKGSQGR